MVNFSNQKYKVDRKNLTDRMLNKDIRMSFDIGLNMILLTQ